MGSSRLLGLEEVPDVPVLVPGGPGLVGLEIFWTDLLHLTSGIPIPDLRFALAGSLACRRVQMDLFWSVGVPF